MKRSILSLVLVSCLVFFGFKKANAASTATISNISSTSAITPAALTSSQLNGVVYAMSVVNSGNTNGTLTGATFTSTGSAPNATTTTYTVWYQTAAQGATFTGAGGIAGTLTAPTTANASLVFAPFTTAIPIAKTATTYVFLVENISIPNTAGGIKFGYSSVTTTATLTAPATPLGTAYTWNAATTVALNSFNVAGANGLATNPLYQSQTNVPVYGFSLTAGTTGSTANIAQITLHVPTGIYDYFLGTTATLYSCTTNNYSTGTLTPISTYTCPNSGAAADAYAAFNTSITIPATGLTTFYFVTIDAPNYYSPSTAFENDFSSSVGTIISGSPTTGANYTISGATAPTITAANDAAGLSPVSGATIYTAPTNLAVAGISLKTSANTATLSKLVFTYSIAGGTAYSSYFGTPVLYYSNSATFDGTAQPVAGATATVTTVAPFTITFAPPTTYIPPASAIPLITTTNIYYYLVVNYTGAGPTTKVVTFVPTSYNTIYPTIASAASLGYPVNTYTCGTPGPYVLTINSLTTSPNTSGLANTPVAYGSANYSVYGFSLVGSGSVAGTSTISSLTFTQNGGTPDPETSYYGTASLYSSTNPIFQGTGNAASTLIGSPVPASSTLSTIVFPTNISASNSSNLYYFIVLNNTLGDNNASPFRLTYTSSTVSAGTAVTTGATVNGPSYTFSPPPPTTVTFASIGVTGGPTSGLVANPINSLQSGIAIYGFTLAGSGSGLSQTISSLTFYSNGTTFANNNAFFPTITLYMSTSPTGAFAGVGNAFTSASLNGTGTVLTASNSAAIVITPTTPLSVSSSTTPVYYYLVVDYNTVAASYANNTYGLNYSSSVTGSGATVNTTATTGFNYTFTQLAITATDVTAGLSPIPGSNVYYGQSGLVVAGMGLKMASTGTTSTLSQVIFTVGPNLATANNYFSNAPQLYSSTSATFSLTGPTPATPVTASISTASAPQIAFTLGTPVTLTTTNIYYYLVVNYSVAPALPAGSTPQAITFTPYGYVSNLSGTTGTTGFTANSYTCAPPVSVSTASTTGLASPTIAGTQPGVGIFGFTATSYPATTFKSFTFSSNIANWSTYFSNAVLYSSTTNSFANASPVTDSYTVGSLASSGFTITITGTSTQTTNNSSLYYFLVVDYTAPASGSIPFTPTLTGFTTSTNTYTTATTTGVGLTVTGTAYTLTPAATSTYYWTGAGATTDWKLKANWATSPTVSTTNSGTYPGAAANDVAIFSPYDNTPTVSIGAYNITVGTITVTTGVSPVITINSANLLSTTTFGIANTTVASRANITNLTINGTAIGSTTPIFQVTGTATFNFNGTLIVPTNGVVNFPSGSSVVLNGYVTNGGASFPGEIDVEGGIVTANTSTISFGTTTYGGEILVSTGSFTATGGTMTMAAADGLIEVDGGTYTTTSCPLNMTSSYSSFIITGGIANLNTSNFSLSSANGNNVFVDGGTLNYMGGTINCTGTLGAGAFFGVLLNGGTFNCGGTTLAQASTINLGTANATGVGALLELYPASGTNTIFNLGAYSVVNLLSKNSEWLNTKYTNGGTTYYAESTCASTSVINPTSTTAIVENDNASNYFTLISDADATATIGKLGVGAKLTGLFNVQRYLNGGAAYLRNYRLLSSPVNSAAAASSQYNSIDLSYLGASATIPFTSTTYNGAFIAGPGAGFGGGIHTIANPIMYLYQENIAPGTAYNSSFTSGKNVGINALTSSGSTSTVGTVSTAAGAGSGSAGSSPSVASTSIALPSYDNSTAAPVPAGNAYLLFYVDNNARTTAASAGGIPNASNITASGYINQGQVQLYMWGSRSASLTDTYGITGVRSPGLTMVGNPYPSTIDLKQVWTDNKTTITPTLYQLDNTTQQFNSYNASTNASSTSLSSEYIGTGLGFYVHVDSMGTTKTFYFQEDQKTASTTASFFPPISEFNIPGVPAQTVDNLVTAPGTHAAAADALVTNNFTAATDVVTLATGATVPVLLHSKPLAFINVAYTPPVLTEVQQPTQPALPAAVINPAGLHLKLVIDSVTNDEVGIYFNKAWSDKYDTNDAYDLDGQSGKAYLSSYTSDGVRTSINMLGDYTPGKERVKLFVKAAADGIYQLQMSDIKYLNTNQYSVFLIDNLKKDSLDLTLYKSYNFNYAVSDTASYKNRFVLAVEHKPVPYYALTAFAGEKITAGVQLSWTAKNENNTTKFVLEKLTANNTYAFLDSLTSDSSGTYAYVDQHPLLGNNTYRLQQTDALGNTTYSSPVTIGYNSTSPNGGLVVYPNPTKSTMTVTLNTSSIASQVATVDIYDIHGTRVEHKSVNTNSFVYDASSYKLGVYIIELKNSNGSLVGKSKFVKVQ